MFFSSKFLIFVEDIKICLNLLDITFQKYFLLQVKIALFDDILKMHLPIVIKGTLIFKINFVSEEVAAADHEPECREHKSHRLNDVPTWYVENTETHATCLSKANWKGDSDFVSCLLFSRFLKFIIFIDCLLELVFNLNKVFLINWY